MSQNSEYPTDLSKPKRTPVRTFSTLLVHGHFTEIFTLLKRKTRAFIKMMERKIPALQNFLRRKYLGDILRFYYGHENERGKNKLRVAVIAQSGNTNPKSSAFIRLISPLTDPSIGYQVNLKLYDEKTLSTDRRTDVCIVQRTAIGDIENARKFVKQLVHNSTRLIIDSDDGFNNVDPSHPEYTALKQRLETYNFLLHKADRVWFSTQELKKSHPEIKDKVSIIPNGLDPRLWKSRSPSVNNSGPLQIVYMGTATHDSDFNMILPAIDSVAKKYPNSFELNIVGVSDLLPTRPWIRLLRPSKGSIYPKFVEWFASNKFDVGLSPLIDSSFNQHKSDIKCLDYLAIGALPVVSDVTPYKSGELDGIITRVPATKQAWEKELIRLVKNPEATRQRIAPMVRAGQEYLWSKRSSETTARLIGEELRKLLSVV